MTIDEHCGQPPGSFKKFVEQKEAAEVAQQQRLQRRIVMGRNVRENARVQATPENRENFFRSCEAHGGELAEIVAEVRREFNA